MTDFTKGLLIASLLLASSGVYADDETEEGPSPKYRQLTTARQAWDRRHEKCSDDRLCISAVTGAMVRLNPLNAEKKKLADHLVVMKSHQNVQYNSPIKRFLDWTEFWSDQEKKSRMRFLLDEYQTAKEERRQEDVIFLADQLVSINVMNTNLLFANEKARKIAKSERPDAEKEQELQDDVLSLLFESFPHLKSAFTGKTLQEKLDVLNAMASRANFEQPEFENLLANTFGPPDEMARQRQRDLDKGRMTIEGSSKQERAEVPRDANGHRIVRKTTESRDSSGSKSAPAP